MIVRTNPSWHCANHTGKVQNGSRVTNDTCSNPMEKERGIGMCLSSARGQDVPHWLLVKCSSTSSALGCTWWERSRAVIPSGQGRNGAGMSPSNHRAKTASHRKWEYPPSLQQCPLWGARDQQSPQWTVMLFHPPKRSYWELQMARVAVLKIRMTQLWSESFYFCLLASVIWFPSYSLNHSEMCFYRQGQLCHSCFPIFKLEDIH